MVKRIHEVWEDGGQAVMFLRGAAGWGEVLPPHAKCVHVFEAESSFEAFRAYHRLMGWDAWKEPRDVDNVVYADDEVRR